MTDRTLQAPARADQHRAPGLTGFIALVVLSAGAMGLLTYRVFHTRDLAYTFLVWNLVLALVPYLVAGAMTRVDRRDGPGWLLAILGVLWPLFLPNAPYIVTDFVHLGQRVTTLSVGFDALMISAFALIGLALGYLSLLRVHRVVEHRWGSVAGWLLVLIVLPLCVAGVYLGRVYRFNSWDAFTNPEPILSTLTAQLADPLDNPVMLAVVLGATLLLMLGYLAVWATAPREDRVALPSRR